MAQVSGRTRGSLVLLAIVLLSVVPIAQQSEYALFERARLLEDSNQDLAEAISLYEQVADQANGERALAATAQLRVGLIYERLGRPTEAEEAYGRLLRAHPGSPEAADARARLAAQQTDAVAVASGAVVARQVWSGRGANSYGTPSLDGRFLSAVDYDTGDLVLRDLVGGDTRRLTSSQSPDKGGALFSVISPDGRSVAYSWFEDSAVTQLRAIRTDGSNMRVLDGRPDVLYAQPFGWSPDGAEVLALATMRTRRVFGSADGNASWATPSADGRYVFNTDFPGGGDLTMQEIATGEKRRLTDARPMMRYGGFAMNPVPSPDGTQVVMSWLNQELFWELRVASVEGGAAHTLYRNAEVNWVEAVGWTPDGSQILALLGRTDRTNQIALISAADGSAQALKSTDWRAPMLSLSPDGRFVAYDFPPLEESAQRDIYLLAADGSGAATLVEHPANDFLPIWMPDGSGILFLSDRTGTSDLWLLEIEDGRANGPPRPVKRNMGKAIPRGFTRDGSLFYGIWQQERDVYTLTVDPDEGQILEQPRKLSQRHEGSNSWPDWSSDGRYLMYASDRGASAVRPDPVLIVRSLETGSERELVVPQLRYQGQARWSPDGGSILAVGADSRGRNTLYRVDSGTGVAQPLAAGAEGQEVWGVRGDTLFYQRRQELIAHDLKTGEDRVVHDGEARNVTLSPDGRRIAFKTQRSRAEDPVSIVVVPTTGGEPREVFTSESGQMPAGLAWLTNRHLLFTVEERILNINTTRNTELWRVSADGGEPEQLGALVGLEGMVRHLVVHPDGRRVAFTLDNGYVDELWVLENLVAAIQIEH